MSKSSKPSSTAKVAHLALGCAPVLLAAAFAATPASAQNIGQQFQRNKNTSVRSRAHPEYDALGIRSGAFLIFPKVTIDGTYDSNIYANDAFKVDDFVTSVTADVQASSQWSRHRLGAFGRLSRSEYANIGNQSNTTYSVGTTGQLDVQRDFALTGVAQFQHGVEARTASGTPQGARDPVVYELSTFNVGGTKAFNRIRVQSAFSYDDWNYKSFQNNLGQTISQDYRDQGDYKAALRFDYAVSPDTALFVRGEQEWRKFKNGPAIGGIDRDSDGYTLTAGADFELTSLMRGQIQGGYLNYSFDNPGTGDVKSFSADASIEYFPTQLLTLTFTGSRAVGDTGLFSTAGYLTTNVGAQADYELLRNLIITGRFGYGRDTYRGIDRKDKRWSGSVGAIYLLNRSLGVNMQYQRQDQSSAGLAAGPDYGIDRFSISLTLQR